MSDPKHPAKIVIVVEKGCVNGVFFDKEPGNIRIFIADYDNLNPNSECDKHGRPRSITETTGWVDTPQVRAILNKKKGGGDDKA